MTETEVLLVFIGGIFVIEALSVIIQVASFKRTGQARLPDRADPPPLRDEGVVGDEDHGALLDRRRDPLRARLRPLLPLLPALPAVTSAGCRHACPRARARALGAGGRRSRSAAQGVEVVAHDRDASLEIGRALTRARGAPRRRGGRALLDGVDARRQEPRRPGGSARWSSARARGIDVPIWSEIELGARLLPNPIVGVTGTNGKTTTTALLGAMFRAARPPGRRWPATSAGR